MAGGRREASRGKRWIVGLDLEVSAVKTLSWLPMKGGCVGAIQMLDSAGFEGQCIVHLTASGRPTLWGLGGPFCSSGGSSGAQRTHVNLPVLAPSRSAALRVRERKRFVCQSL